MAHRCFRMGRRIYNDSESETENNSEHEEISDSDTEEQADLKRNVYKIQLQKFEIFKAQDPKTGYFDVIFDFDGKLLYAHKFDLTAASDTLKVWLSNQWTTNNDPIKIETYSFEIFYQLCCFLYSGGCNLTTKNIFQIIDAAEFFGIQLLKRYCKRFIEFDEDAITEDGDLFEMLDAAEKYSLTTFKKHLKRYCFFEFNMEKLLENERILQIKKSHLLRLLKAQKSHSFYKIEDKIFEAFVKWTENFVEKKKEESIDENFDAEEALENEFKDFLPYLKFNKLNLDYLVEFLGQKPYLFAPSNLVAMFTKFSGEQNERFKAVYQLAEIQAARKQMASKDENFDFFKIVKDYMAEIISVINFNDMSTDFVVDFLVERSFLFSCKELLKILVESERESVAQEEKLFKAIYEIAENEVLQKHEKQPIENFNLADAIKAELIEFLPSIKFHHISESFWKELPEKYLNIFSFDLLSFYKGLNGEIEKNFRAVYYLTEIQALKRQNESSDANFDLQKVIKDDMAEVIAATKFSQMDISFVLEFLVERSFLFSCKELLKILVQCPRYGGANEFKIFKAMFQIASKEVLSRSNNENLNFQEAIKAELMDFLPKIQFSLFEFDHLIQIADDKSFVFSSMNDFYKLCANCKRRDDQEEQLLTLMYQLAEKEVLKKQPVSLYVIIPEAIKNELSEFFPNIKFYLMSKQFMLDFVVTKGILTYHEAFNVYYLQVEVKSENNLLNGFFDDKFGIFKIVGKDAAEILANHGLKQRFTQFKFPLPSEPSELKKKDGIEWYLCLEADGILAVKHKTHIIETDYLIAELKPSIGRNFVFRKKMNTSLKLTVLNEHLYEEPPVEPQTTAQPHQQPLEPQNPQQPAPQQLQNQRKNKSKNRKKIVQNASTKYHQNSHPYHPYSRPHIQQQQVNQQVTRPLHQPFHQTVVNQLQQQIRQQFNPPNLSIPFPPFQYHYYPRYPNN